MTDWLPALLQRKPRKVAAVALANKMARVAWALMTRGTVYRRPTAAAAAAWPVIRCAAKRYVTIGSGPMCLVDRSVKPPLRAIVELDVSELQTVEPPRGFGRD